MSRSFRPVRQTGPVEYRDERDLNIYTDGSSFQHPRRGGAGIVFVTVDDDGREHAATYPVFGFEGATNQQMELYAAAEALRLVATNRAPVPAARWRKIVIWTDSMYLVDGYRSALFTWPGQAWMTRDGNPVANTELWKELVRNAWRLGGSVEIKWVKGHKHSEHNKHADKLARQSAKLQIGQRLSVTKARRKTSAASVSVGSVAMRGQRLRIRVVTSEYLPTQRLSKLKYEVVSRASEFYEYVDMIYAPEKMDVSAGHTYDVRVGLDQGRPRIAKLFREVVKARPK